MESVCECGRNFFPPAARARMPEKLARNQRGVTSIWAVLCVSKNYVYYIRTRNIISHSYYMLLLSLVTESVCECGRNANSRTRTYAREACTKPTRSNFETKFLVFLIIITRLKMRSLEQSWQASRGPSMPKFHKGSRPSYYP